MASWRPGTGKQYHSHLGRGEEFCAQKTIVVEEASVEYGINFLASLYEDGLGDSAINTARSAYLLYWHSQEMLRLVITGLYLDF